MINNLKIQKSYKNNKGILYLVPTPIGNLEDMTFRAVKILKAVDLIASEDTRNTQKLLNYFQISKQQISLHEHNYKERVPELIAYLEQGKSIAQVSDAGMPSISDPGHELVVSCLEKDINVISLPGATAGVTALIASGLLPQPFVFHGFLPRKKKDIEEALAPYQLLKGSLIFYESPYRIHKTLAILGEIYPLKTKICLARELTKIHEEYLRGTLAELIEYTAQNQLKGEMCLIMEHEAVEQENKEDLTLSLKEQVEKVIAKENLSSKEAIKKVAKQNKIKKQEVYQAYHEL